MTNIEEKLTTVLSQVEEHPTRTTNLLGRLGSWTIRWISNQFGKRSSDILAAERFSKMLCHLEKVPMQQEDAKQVFSHWHKVQQRLDQQKTDEAQALSLRLMRLIIGFFYRVEQTDQTMTINLDHFNKLQELATSWKPTQAAFNNPALTDRDRLQLKETCRYPIFVQLLLKDPLLRDRFFKWTLRSGLSVPIFIEFPQVQQRLTNSLLSKRIGRIDPNHLKLTLTPTNKHKIVTLKIEGKEINILDESAVVTLKNNYQLTIEKIFHIFENKTYDIGNLEYTAEGIANWHPFHLGPWNPKTKAYDTLDLKQKEWWKQLPLFEVITPEKTQSLYGEKVNPNDYAVIAKAARSIRSLDMLGNHGWMEVLIPTEDGCFHVLPFGKYESFFAQSNWENICRLFGTMPASISYPEENVFKTFRQEGGKLFKITAKQFHTLMDGIKKDIIAARNKNIVFQFLAENCSYWVEKQLRHILGSQKINKLYRIKFWESHITGTSKYIFGPIQKIPHQGIRRSVANIVGRLFGGHKGIYIRKGNQKIHKSVLGSELWKKEIAILPAALIHKIESAN